MKTWHVLLLLTSLLWMSCSSNDPEPSNNSVAHYQKQEQALTQALNGTVDYRISSMTTEAPITLAGQSYGTDWLEAMQMPACQLDDSLLIEFVPRLFVSETSYDNSQLLITQLWGTKSKCNESQLRGETEAVSSSENLENTEFQVLGVGLPLYFFPSAITTFEDQLFDVQLSRDTVAFSVVKQLRGEPDQDYTVRVVLVPR
ncbi:MAG: hypothetical protein RIG62_18265 [Cyclobacteriaceae bacterium]